MGPSVAYSAQIKDWAGRWSSDGGIMVSTAREAYDRCVAHLTSLGYSGFQIRVLRHVTSTTVTVVGADEFMHDPARSAPATREGADSE